MKTFVTALAALAAGAIGLWFALNARPHRDKAASPPPLETWEGEGGQVAAAPGTARERD
jgi:hypothetical protein